MPTWQAVAIGIIPSIGVGLVFWFAMRAVVRADRNERAALAKADAEQAAERAQRDNAAAPEGHVHGDASQGGSQD